MRTSTILILLGCLLGASPAFAGEVGVVVIGDTAIRTRLTAQLDEWFRSHGHTPVDSAIPSEASTALLACVARSDEPCARAVLAKRGAIASLVLAKAEARASKDGIADVELTAYWFRAGQDTVAERRFCERCTDQMLRQSSDELLSALVASDTVTTAHVTLTSVPAGATVLVDGAAIGATPLTYDIAAGRHQLTISAPDYDVDTRELVLRAGDTTHIDVPLSSRGTGAATTPVARSRSSLILPSASMLGGAVLAASGGYVLYRRFAQDEKYEYRRGLLVGVPLTLVGLAAITGGYLWFRHAASPPASAPTAFLLHDGAVVGWTSTF